MINSKYVHPFFSGLFTKARGRKRARVSKGNKGCRGRRLNLSKEVRGSVGVMGNKGAKEGELMREIMYLLQESRHMQREETEGDPE